MVLLYTVELHTVPVVHSVVVVGGTINALLCKEDISLFASQLFPSTNNTALSTRLRDATS